ncbi:DUF5675 family protein [Sphingobacterium sp. UDSM-2020]|uniref:DUF5675 family protein n=1 Tax=Sphingobacterium sp. UDSM-2020 TaxID=2795738 RepID=UPI001935993C|nr:DUF5675 family protein [Sphingobacterium sp. UDSM-2020]QQD11639.1 hypothetical protein JAZ75_13460 [Sphingobacterium sp. UDSM-2020]
MKSGLKVIRIRQGNNSTLSEIYLDNQFVCYGLEDIPREKKILGSTCIPLGIYRLGFNRNGGMNGNYYDRYPKMHRGMIEIKDIPGFSYVYIHIGNTHKETAGCLLVGTQYVFEKGDYRLVQSVTAYKKLYSLLAELMVREEVGINIVPLSPAQGDKLCLDTKFDKSQGCIP